MQLSSAAKYACSYVMCQSYYFALIANVVHLLRVDEGPV